MRLMNESNTALDSAAEIAATPSAESGAWGAPIIVKPSRTATATRQPVVVGVPYPKGMLRDQTAVALVDPAGRDVPSQCEVLAKWSDGSVQWLLVDFLLPYDVGSKSVFRLRDNRGGVSEFEPPAAPKIPVTIISEAAAEFVVAAGGLDYHINRSRTAPLLSIEGPTTAGRELGSLRARLTDARGRAHEAVVERSMLETIGSVRTTVYLEALFPKCRGLRLKCRLCFFADSGLVRVRPTLHNPNRARHRGGLWDLGDAGSILFRDFSLLLDLPGGGSRVVWRSEPDEDVREVADSQVEVYQDSSGGENWRSHNHVNRERRVPCRFRGYREQTSGGERHGLRSSPTMVLAADKLQAAVAVPEFWQQFPKLMSAEPGQIRVGLWPREWDDLHELQGGEQKTHTVWFRFGAAAEFGDGFCQTGKPDLRATAGALAWVHTPAVGLPDPRWTAETKALTPFLPATDDPDERLPALLWDAIDGEQNLLAKREIIDEYGWRNYGDVYADHENAYYSGPKPVISHYNNQYDFVYGALLHWLRSENRAWIELAKPLAQHVIDVDIYHTTQDRAVYSGGLFWHTDHYFDAATATHRTFSRANATSERLYGGGPCCEQNYATGLLHYFYLTGDRQAREAVVGLADWVVRMDDGRNNVFGLVDKGPSGAATWTCEPGYHGPGRGAGNSVNVLLDGWLATGERRYLNVAETLIRRVVHPADEIASGDLLNVERRWSYTLFFVALARYLDLKAEAGELDPMYCYAQASLVHYARWMFQNERRYFDRPEQLQYPTETWAAQEFHKANVLRLAASHAEQPWRSQLLARGHELADAAWRDLQSFPSRTVTRAIAIMLTAGLRDCMLRVQDAPRMPEARHEHDFGKPQQFVPQRTRVLEQLKSVRGIARAAACLLRPRVVRRAIALSTRSFRAR